MAKDNLVVVESVAKARTIEKFLGRQYRVRACMGHVRDLPKSALGVDTEHDFTPKYLIPKEKKDVVKELKAQAKSADTVYLATDPDREGEAIAWHLVSALDLADKPVRRIEFHEVTKSAVQDALSHPRGIDLKRVDAQQARRVLDRLVGYKLSPLLWNKVRYGLSAGRVQSVALRLVVDREREIQAFVPVEYWTVDADLSKQGQHTKASTFRAGLIERDGKRLQVEVGADAEGKTRSVTGFASHEEAEAALGDLERAAYRVLDVRRTERVRNPAAPFTTSTLQQEASRKLGFTARRTMRVAQQLYEGVDIGQGQTVGLITYMRTDSVNVAESAVREVRDLVVERYGHDFLEPSPRVFRTRSRLAQEAHEAIRPTLAARSPDQLRAHLTPEQFRLYDLVWKRFVASQMAAARFDVTTVDVEAAAPDKPRYLLRAVGSILRFPGFLSVYSEGRDDGEADDEGKQPLPDVAARELLDLLQLLPEQHYTQPPPRYTEATLVKALEENGIGRPSTYAPILSTIQDRQYVEKEDKRFVPTALGEVVNDLLVEQFPEIVNVEFTAEMEEKLDDVAKGEQPWVPVIRSFYEPFEAKLELVKDLVERRKVPVEETDEVCDKCGEHRMVIRQGKFGRFIGCKGFPTCRNARPILTKVGVDCPECGGDLVERRGAKSRRLFFGCAKFPECSFSSWSRPLAERCPRCGWLQVEAGREKIRCLRCNPEPEQRRLGRRASAGGDGVAGADGAVSTGGRANGKTTRKSTTKTTTKTTRRTTARKSAARATRGGKVVSGARAR